MDEKQLKTSWKQRLGIAIIAALMLGSSLMLYAGIVLGGNKDAATTAKQNEETAKIQEELTAKQSEMTDEAKKMGAKYLEEMKGYKSRVKAYNATTANSEGLKTNDLKKGNGTEITSEWNDYLAYYIGFCADEKVFDSSFDNYEKPTSLKDPISGQLSLVAGWTEGVIGMKVGGAREVTIPSELGYGDTDQAENVCGKGAPMRFVIYAIEPSGKYKQLKEEYDNKTIELYMAQMGK